MNTHTRFKITIAAAFFLASLATLSIIMKMETVAVTSITGILTILSAYIWAQTKRPTHHEPSHKSSNPATNHLLDSTRLESDDATKQ